MQNAVSFTSNTASDWPDQNQLRAFIIDHVYSCQTALVCYMGYHPSEISNFYYTETEIIENGYSVEEAVNTGQHMKEIYEWWLVSDWLLAKLKEHGEPILENEYGSWWGRTCTGQAIFLDVVIAQIYREM